MARLIPCPSCGRHVRAVERDCPFCGHAGLTTGTPARLSMLLLGLCLAACTSPTAPAEVAPKPAEPAKAEPEVVEPGKVIEQAEPEPESQADTTGAEETTGGDETTGSEGTDEGASTEPPASKPPTKTKYGGPREDPRPAKKYGAPPGPDIDF